MNWEQLNDRYDAFSQREKVILSAVVLILLLFIFLQFVWEPAWKRQDLNALSLTDAQTLQISLNTQKQTLESALAKDPNAALREENQSLLDLLESRQDKLRDSLARLVAPEEMPGLLVSLLGDNPGLEVMRVEKLPTLKIQHGEGDGAAVLYSHRMRIVVKGGYFDALQYVQKIEQQQGKLRLVNLSYEVESYPEAMLTLELETLGLDERWLGV